MIVKTYQINGMHCMGCVNKVQKAFISHNHISEADVNLKNASVKLQMTNKLQLDELMDVLKNIGDYEMIENESEIHHNKFQLSAYKPLLLVIGFILLVSILSSYKTSFQLMNWMTNFMGGFFIAFSFFKFLDLNGFSNSFATYDIIAKKWKGYGKIYPFIELGLGVAYLLAIHSAITNTICILILTASTIGVIQAVLGKKQIQCACLGTVFNLPMSTVTIIENFTMISMAIFSLIFNWL